jgi:tRNA uridine 5-carbamoylmethylation protein Kti12
MRDYATHQTCMSDSVLTPNLHCRFYVPSEQISANNDQRGDSKYLESQIVELPMRFERPNDRNRWERPLFEVAVDDESLPVQDIAHVLAGFELKANCESDPPMDGECCVCACRI